MMVFKATTRITLLFLTISLPLSVWAADLKTAAPAREGMSAERLARIDGYMNKAVDEGVMVGGMGMIARSGRVVYTSTWGQADREAGKPMETDTIFRIYSMTKPITSVALMML